MDASPWEPYPPGDGSEPYPPGDGSDPRDATASFPPPPPRAEATGSAWTTVQALLTPARTAAQSAAERVRAAALELADSDTAQSAALLLRDAARDVAERLDRMSPPTSPQPAPRSQALMHGPADTAVLATTTAPAAMEPSPSTAFVPMAASPADQPTAQVFANTTPISVRVVVVHVSPDGDVLVWAGYKTPLSGQQSSLELPDDVCPPTASEAEITATARTSVRNQVGASLATDIHILGRLPSANPSSVRRQIFVVGMLASAAPNNIIPEFRSRSDAKFNGYAWIRYSECRPSATPSAALDLLTGRYSMLILPSGTQQNGMMREADVEALRHFWDDVMRYAQLATPAIAPASSARSPPPNVQFQRGSLMPPSVIPAEADTPPRQLAFTPNPSAIRIMQRPSNSYPGNASSEMELEQQLALMRDQQEIERRNMEANVQARVDAERRNMEANVQARVDAERRNLEASMQARLEAEITRRVQEMSGRTPPNNQDLSSNFQRSFINLLPERVQSYINMPVSTLAPPMQHAAATDVVAPVTPPEHGFVPQQRRASYELPSTYQPPRMPSQQMAPRPASIVDPRHQQVQHPVMVIQSSQQTGRLCFFSGHRGKSTTSTLNARDFMKSFEVVRATQLQWSEQQAINECKHRCSAKLDDQLATFAQWEQYGWEAWKAKFIDHFRHILDDHQKMSSLLNAKCDGSISTFNAYFEQLINEVKSDLCGGVPFPDAALRHIYMNALPKELRSQAATQMTTDKTLFEIMQLCAHTEYFSCLPQGPSDHSAKDKARENFNSITKEATAKIVEAISAQTAAAEEDATFMKIMSVYERAPGDAAWAFKLTAEERDRRRRHNLCFNEECKGPHEHDFREREKCQDPNRRALASKQPRQTRFSPRHFRRPSSPAVSLNRAHGTDGETSEEGDATEGDDSDAFDDTASHGR